MNYQVLARKWRPRNFTEMVGQEHVLRALINALDQQRLHHAYLFTGTRGVGKTTIARILAKCLNCLNGVSANPCGQCTACQEIDQGRFIDLLEVDAASRTKVEDTRELLENVQYAPTRGQYKIYLIDEVHMLSNHSFNALLKTLEEPPPHVKFLLATTDPQRLPATVLSRCLQFHLKNLSPERITEHLKHVLEQEKIAYELPALKQLGHAANGSMRDALSLLDQAIAFGQHRVNAIDVAAMLGSIPQQPLLNLLAALAKRNAELLFQEITQMAEQGIDFAFALEELLSLLQRIAVILAIPTMAGTDELHDAIKQLAQSFTAEEVQLYYQIGLIGRRDLPYAPSARSGFEMIMLRMLTFRPVTEELKTMAAIPPAATAKDTKETAKPAAIIVKPAKLTADNQSWEILLKQLNLSGLSLVLAQHCTIKIITENEVHLLLEANQTAMLNNQQQQRIAQALSEHFGKPIKLTITVSNDNIATPAALEKHQQQQRQQAAVQAITNDVNVQSIIQTFDAKLTSEAIKPIGSS